MLTAGGLEFVNREKELLFLERCFAASPALPALVFLRGPAGIGKSSLTDRFRSLRGTADLPFCMVDPNILDSPAAPSLYQGLFLQRCAAAADEAASRGGADWPTFSEFLRLRRWKTAKEKPRHELIDQLPSPESLYKQALDYASRLLSMGRFEPRFVLESDQSYAVALCAAYLQHSLEICPAVLVVREAQLIDIFSLRTLLGWQLTGTPTHLIFEYTTEAGFLPIHEKAILRAAEMRGNFSVLDVAKLSFDHLEQLIRSVGSNFSLDTQAHVSWSGNLRSVLELKFRVGIGQTAALPADVQGLLANLERSISDHVAGLPRVEKLVLALLHANAEPLAQSILQRQLGKLDVLFRPAHLPRLLDGLIDMHGFVQRAGGAFRLQNETIAQAIAATPRMSPLLAVAEKALRDYYRDIVSTADYATVGLPAALRQVFRLSVVTKDVTGLVASCSVLLDQVRHSQDQSMYVDAVSAAVDADPQLYQGEYEDLLIWAASLAYDTSDWEKAADLLEASGSATAFALAMRAFALQEVGRHDEALALAKRIAKGKPTRDEELLARLVEILVRGCRGDVDFARQALLDIVDGSRFQQSLLLGYAFRFFDVVEGLAGSLPRLEASVAWFDGAGLHKARAYSELPTAILLARVGRGEEARRLIERARSILETEVRDQHIILNNSAAVELLSHDPDAAECVNQLTAALRYARDDFSELTIITNLGLARWAAGSVEDATQCAERTLEILENHDFADQDIFWPVCFNAMQIFDAAGRPEGREKAIRLLAANRIESANQAYWDFRYGWSDTVPPEYGFLATKPMHPVYLSHWTVELEGLSLLRPESRL